MKKVCFSLRSKLLHFLKTHARRRLQPASDVEAKLQLCTGLQSRRALPIVKSVRRGTRRVYRPLDCHVASLLAMTGRGRPDCFVALLLPVTQTESVRHQVSSLRDLVSLGVVSGLRVAIATHRPSPVIARSVATWQSRIPYHVRRMVSHVAKMVRCGTRRLYRPLDCHVASLPAMTGGGWADCFVALLLPVTGAGRRLAKTATPAGRRLDCHVASLPAMTGGGWARRNTSQMAHAPPPPRRRRGRPQARDRPAGGVCPRERV